MENNNSINGVISLDNDKKKIYLMVIGIVVAVIFVIVMAIVFNKKDEDNGIDIKVSTGDNLQISIDGLNWYSEINREMLEKALTNYSNSISQLPAKLGSVSTAGYVDNGKLEMYYMDISNENGETSFTAVKEDEVQCLNDRECDSRYFIAFDVFLMAKEPLSIGLSNESKVSYIEKTKDLGFQNAARVGFVLQGTVASDKYLDAQALKGGFNSYIWEPNADVHKKEVIKYAKENFDMDIETTDEAPISYKGINTEFIDKINIKDINDSLNFTDVNHVVTTSKEFEDNQVLFDVSSGITKIRIYLWVEGQDIDMLNKTEVRNLQYDIKFTIME